MTRVTADQCVRALKDHRLSTTARAIAADLGCSPRAVATALRGPTRDGRVKIRFIKGFALYRFARLHAHGIGSKK